MHKLKHQNLCCMAPKFGVVSVYTKYSTRYKSLVFNVVLQKLLLFY